MRERIDEGFELDDGAGPAVNEQQREGCVALAADVPEVQFDAIDLAGELRMLVEARLAISPIVAVAPVVAEFPNVGEVCAVVPADIF